MLRWLKKRKPFEYISGLAISVALVDLLGVEVTWVTVTLIGIAMAPWLFTLDRIHKYVETLELPGGVKLALRHASQEAQQIELEGGEGNSDMDAFIETLRENPNLTLIAIRVELERQLRRLVIANGASDSDGVHRIGVRSLQKFLLGEKLLNQKEVSLMNDIWPVLNRAAHAEFIDSETQEWAIQAARPLLINLEARADKLSSG